ncbi:putative phage tail protein [Lysinibacillus fusiformis]|uniref:putative phage tail protein n=1 Tax=Lysinibacillus fusiformis TaxID=28031 RepID=UPI003D07E5E8
MAREVDVLSYLAPVFHEIKELQKIASLENPSLERIWELTESLLNNQFILTLDERGASRYEKMLGLVAGESETLETRRFRILSRYQEQAPYSYPVLKQLLDSLLGEGKYELTRSTSEKWVRVKLELTVSRQFEIVEVLLERVTPQNMLLYVEVRYNQHSTLARFTHAQLAAYTHKHLREEVLP